MPDIFKSEENNQPTEKEEKENQEEEVTQPKVKSTIGKKEHRKKNHVNPVSSFIYNPDKVNFVNKDPEEEVILVLRRHVITNLKWIIAGILLFLAPLVLTLMPFFEVLPPNYQFVGVLVWYLVSMAFVLEQFLAWFFNVNIVTDERVFDVDFVNLVYREMTDANIDQIQDVTVKMGSPIRTVFNYGDVLIQTASEVPRIVFEAVPQPDRVARILRELRVEEEQEKIEGRVR